MHAIFPHGDFPVTSETACWFSKTRKGGLERSACIFFKNERGAGSLLGPLLLYFYATYSMCAYINLTPQILFLSSSSLSSLVLLQGVVSNVREQWDLSRKDQKEGKEEYNRLNKRDWGRKGK